MASINNTASILAIRKSWLPLIRQFYCPQGNNYTSELAKLHTTHTPQLVSIQLCVITRLYRSLSICQPVRSTFLYIHILYSLKCFESKLVNYALINFIYNISCLNSCGVGSMFDWHYNFNILWKNIDWIQNSA